MKVVVVVYGTLKRGCSNHSVMRDQSGGVFLGEETIKGLRMQALHGGYPGVVLDDAHHVNTEVFEVDSLEMLDWLEGYDPDQPEHGLYNRVEISTSYGPALVYVYNGEMYGPIIETWEEGEDNDL